jgi:hypothetical protein
MRNGNSVLRGLSLCSMLAAALSMRAEADWTRHFRIGASFGLNVKTDFKTSGTFSLANPPPSARGGITYDDGFVGPDATGSANGTTSFWGYNNSSQFNAGTDRLTFRQTQSFDANGANKANDNPLGFDMVYGGTIRQWEHLSIGAEFGFGLSVFQTRDRNAFAGTLTQRVDQYDVGGTVLPAAPYSGPESGVGPQISVTPIPQGTQQVAGSITGSRSLEGLLYNFRVGPLLRWEFYPRWTLNGSAGGAFGVFDAVYRFNETISTTTTGVNNRGKFGTTDLTYGGYAGAVVMFDTGNAWEAYLGGHFMSLSDGKIESAGRSARMHLGSAIFITAGINWTF